MHDQRTDPAPEVKRLQRCMNDLVSVLALPAIWNGSEPGRILDTFLDALLAMLDLDFLYARVQLDSHQVPTDALKTTQLYGTTHSQEDLSHALSQWPVEIPHGQSEPVIRHLGEQEVSVFPIRMGTEGELGLIVAGSHRPGFPKQTESLVLRVAANQLAIGLQQARLLGEQKQVASELDRRVAERTRELAETNQQLQLQVGLLQRLPVSAWTLKPDGTPDFVNQVWLEFSGQTLDFVRSHPEAWMTVIHPEDREAASRAFWKGVRSGQGFAFETRSIRAMDGTYRWHLQQAVVLRDAEGKVLKFVGTTTDIDDQKRAEEELRASEHNLRQILDSIPGYVCAVNSIGEVDFVNRQFLEYYNKTFDELKDWSVNETVHPDDLPRVIDIYSKSIANEIPLDHEHRCRRFDGIYRWFHFRSLPVRDAHGHIARWYILGTDIEDRKRAEDALRASENNLRHIIDGIPGLVTTMTPSGELELVNRRFLDYYGMTMEEMKSWATNDAIHPDDLARSIAIFTETMRTGTAHELELRCRRADGVYRWFQLTALPVRDTDGRMTGWYVLMTDIEDRKRAEEALRIRELNLLQITETIPEMLWSASPDGAIEYCNGRLLEYTGVSPEQIMNDGWMNLLHPDDVKPTAEAWMSSVKSGAPYKAEVRAFHAADRTYRWCMTSALPLLDKEGRIVKWHGTVVDMHDWKHAQEELRNTQEELARVMRVVTMGQLTASIAHEVNQPLSGIIMNASTCLRMLKSDPPNIDGAQETAQRMIRDGKRASEVITRLRTLFSRKQIDIELVDLNEATREIITLLSGELQRNSVILKCEFGDSLPTVNGDRVQLQQVILNLLRNGLDAMVTVNDRPRQLLIRTEMEGGNVTVSVQDSGVGFNPEISERLFESFFTTKPEGMGIGLAVSRSIIEAHHGRLWAVQNASPGATFAFSIPHNVGNTPNQAK
ncbi:MAG: PAS domain-containing protein [Terracidiphilus sp.]|jgi:PAS domain S-box-containing protein